MITYPCTHGVFEETSRRSARSSTRHGGQVYMDGANMNAQVGLCRPGDIGADVCHLNLHKTFCIPHGGGGPGMGPIGVAKQLAPFLPGHPVIEPDVPANKSIGPGLRSAVRQRQHPHDPLGLHRADGRRRSHARHRRSRSSTPTTWRSDWRRIIRSSSRGKNGRVAHEFILDCRQFEQSAGVKVEDIAKRLMDYGFHAPTMSWPVPGTLMIEPTESESKAELDRFCDAMIRIREEIRAIEEGKADRADNALKNAPHTAPRSISDGWSHQYSREQAAYPAPWLRDNKFCPFVARMDNPYGDRNLVCTCPPVTEYAE